MEKVPNLATDAVLVKSESMPEGSEEVKGYDFNQGVDHHKLLQSYLTSGFQATNFGLAVEQINAMIAKKQEPLQLEPDTEGPKTNCTIFLGLLTKVWFLICLKKCFSGLFLIYLGPF